VDKPPLDFDTLAVGDTFGPLDYVLTQEKMELYRRAVSDPQAAFATIASKDYAVLLRTRYDLGRVVNAKHESRYSRPPEIGALIRTSGRLADKYERRGHRFIVMETTSREGADEVLVESRTTLMLGTPKEAA
jgi:hypothetical protein